MIQLHGFALSNYYNKVKILLLEKAVPFEEKMAMTGKPALANLAQSPMAKVPFVVTPEGPLSESQVIMDYIERAHPQPSYVPGSAYATAKMNELITYIELHLELAARELYGQAFFGAGQLPQEVRDSVQKRLAKAIPAFKSLTKFSPYIGGDQFTQADMAAYVHLPVVGSATKAVYGSDMLLDTGVDWKTYTKTLAQRASIQKVDADKKAFLSAQKGA